jgi:hypothetical protein
MESAAGTTIFDLPADILIYEILMKHAAEMLYIFRRTCTYFNKIMKHLKYGKGRVLEMHLLYTEDNLNNSSNGEFLKKYKVIPDFSSEKNAKKICKIISEYNLKSIFEIFIGESRNNESGLQYEYLLQYSIKFGRFDNFKNIYNSTIFTQKWNAFKNLKNLIFTHSNRSNSTSSSLYDTKKIFCISFAIRYDRLEFLKYFIRNNIIICDNKKWNIFESIKIHMSNTLVINEERVASITTFNIIEIFLESAELCNIFAEFFLFVKIGKFLLNKIINSTSQEECQKAKNFLFLLDEKAADIISSYSKRNNNRQYLLTYFRRDLLIFAAKISKKSENFYEILSILDEKMSDINLVNIDEESLILLSFNEMAKRVKIFAYKKLLKICNDFIFERHKSIILTEGIIKNILLVYSFYSCLSSAGNSIYDVTMLQSTFLLLAKRREFQLIEETLSTLIRDKKVLDKYNNKISEKGINFYKNLFINFLLLPLFYLGDFDFYEAILNKIINEIDEINIKNDSSTPAIMLLFSDINFDLFENIL